MQGCILKSGGEEVDASVYFPCLLTSNLAPNFCDFIMKRGAIATTSQVRSPIPRRPTFREFLSMQTARILQINLELANQRIFVLKNNPNITHHSSRTKLIAWLKAESRMKSQALHKIRASSNTHSILELLGIKFSTRKARRESLQASKESLKHVALGTGPTTAKERQDLRDVLELLHNVGQYETIGRERARRYARNEMYNKIWNGTAGRQLERWWWYFFVPQVWPVWCGSILSVGRRVAWLVVREGNKHFRLNANLEPWEM